MKELHLITIDNKKYDLDCLSEDAKAQLFSLQFCDQELARLQARRRISNSSCSLLQGLASRITR